MAAEGPDEVLIIDAPAGSSPAAARNEGARRTDAELLVFVDADVEPHADAFTLIRAAFADSAGVVGVFGSYDDLPTAPGAVSGFRNLLHHHVHHSSPGPVRTFWAGLGAVRREAFVAAGGFDADRYRRPSIEDIELGQRLALEGEIRLDPAIQGTHLKAWTLTSMVATDLRRRGIPWVVLLLRTGADRSTLNLGWPHRLSTLAAAAGLVAAARRRPVAATLAFGGLVALNHRFYALLLRRRGPREAALGVGLHALHLLTGAAAVPAGVVAYLLARDESGRPFDAHK